MSTSLPTSNLTDKEKRQIGAFLRYLRVNGFRLWLTVQLAKQMTHAITVNAPSLVTQLISDILNNAKEHDGEWDLSQIGLAAPSLRQLVELVNTYDKDSKVLPANARPSEEALHNCFQDFQLLVADRI